LVVLRLEPAQQKHTFKMQETKKVPTDFSFTPKLIALSGKAERELFQTGKSRPLLNLANFCSLKIS
jgi:hypothetical protein